LFNKIPSFLFLIISLIPPSEIDKVGIPKLLASKTLKGQFSIGLVTRSK
jgi:hypothetical protein